MQIGDGESVVWEKTSGYGYGKFAELLKGFKKVNPNCKIVSISIQGYGSEMFYRGSNILNIAGWSESIFDVINSKFCGYKNMIEEIKKIKITILHSYCFHKKRFIITSRRMNGGILRLFCLHLLKKNERKRI